MHSLSLKTLYPNEQIKTHISEHFLCILSIVFLYTFYCKYYTSICSKLTCCVLVTGDTDLGCGATRLTGVTDEV